MPLPKNFPHRTQTIPGWATVFKVPRYVSRVDIDEFGKAGTHGWQVRYRGRNRFFSDAHFGTRKIGSPRMALEAATAHLASIYEGPPALWREKPSPRKLDKSMEVGLREVRRERKNRNMVEIFIEASAVSETIGPKRFYVGTTNTVTPERMKAALSRARAHRKAAIDSVRIARAREILDWLVAQKNAQ